MGHDSDARSSSFSDTLTLPRVALVGLPGVLLGLRWGILSLYQTYAIGFVGTVAFLLWRLRTFIHNASRISHVPGRKFLLSPFATLPALLLPEIRYITAGLSGGLPIDAEALYEKNFGKYGSTISSIQGAFPPTTYLLVCDKIAIKHIFTNVHSFPKNTSIYFAIKQFGSSLIIAEGADFRRHRRIVAPAFAGDGPNELDWQESTKVTNAWISQLHKQAEQSGNKAAEERLLDRCLDLTLYVICRTAFGISAPMPGERPEKPPPGFRYAFSETLHYTMQNIFTIIATPPFLKGWFPSKPVQTAFTYREEMDKWMEAVVKERRAQIKDGEEVRSDLLSSLIRSNNAAQSAEEAANPGVALSKQVLEEFELQGNIWLFLLAG